MKKLFIFCSLVFALSGFMAFNAVAAMINGGISFSGTAATFPAGPLDEATSISFSEVVVSDTGGSGDYAPVPANTPVTFTGFTLPPSFSPVTPLTPLWTFGVGGLTYSFDATGLTDSFSSTNILTMEGIGIAHITGFEDTPGIWNLSSNQAGGTASFSSSSEASAVPIPAAAWLLGSGLLGLVAIRRRFKK